MNSTHNVTSNPTTAVYPNGKKYYIFLIAYLVGLSAFGSFVNDMYLPSLPEMKSFFGCSVSVVQLGLTFGMIGLGLGQIILGPISDKYGRKPILLSTVLLFIIAATISVFSPTIHFFLGCRLFQGLGASGGYFLARTIPADIYGGRQLAKVMALIGAINGFAPASAPMIGGALVRSVGWQGIFCVLAGYATLLFAFAFYFKESLSKNKRYQGPLVDSYKEYSGLIHNRKFMTHVMLKGTALGLLYAYVSSSPFIIQTHFGYTPLQFGFIMGFNAIFLAVGSIISLKFKQLKQAASVGGWIMLISTALQIAILLKIDSFLAYEIAVIPMVFAMGMIFTVGNTLAMNEGRQNAGGASAILGLMGYIFGAIVAPLVGLGNVLRSSAIVFGIMAVTSFIFCALSSRLAPDPNMQ